MSEEGEGGGRRAIVAGVERHLGHRSGSYKTVECDFCGRQEHERGEFSEVAAYFRTQGWRIPTTREGGVKDACPTCVEAGR